MGDIGEARIFAEEHPRGLAVPTQCIVKDLEEGSVIALVDGDKATRKAVKTGVRDGTLIEIGGDGLQEGQSVVTVGAYGLPKETKIRLLNLETK